MATALVSQPPVERAAGQNAHPSTQAPDPNSSYRKTGHTPLADRTFLKDTLLENHHLENSTTSKLLDLLVVVALHVAFIGGPILAGLYFTDTLNLKQFYSTTLVAPPPPPPPPPAPVVAVRAIPPKRVFTNAGKLLAPTYIPRKAEIIKEQPLEPDLLGGSQEGVPGGVPGGQMGGVIGGIVSGLSHTNVIAPPSAPRAPVRVGGKVKPPRPLFTPAPVYPVIARQARVQGTVLIDAIVDTDGSVIEVKLVSGNPLLIQAALDAVRNWRYEPSYLNGEVVQVALIVTVTFQLSQ